VIIRAKTFENWMRANFDRDLLRDIAQRADAGWYGLTYYTDTTKLYNRFEDEIWEALVSDTEDFGYKTVYEFMAIFNPQYAPTDPTTFKNQLVWYMAERIARQLTDE